MEQQHINFQFLYSLTSDDTYTWLQNEGLLTDKFLCPKCNQFMKLNKTSRTEYIWCCQKYGDNPHRIKRSIRKGTWFDASKLTIKQILLLTYAWVGELPSKFIAKDMKMGAGTVNDWRSMCRDVCAKICLRDNVLLGGDGILVEMDECKFGENEKRWVFGGVERGTDKCFMSVVDDKDKNKILELIKKHIRPGSVIIGDFLLKYDCLDDQEFMQHQLDYKLIFKSPEGKHMNSINGTWSAVKNTLSKNTNKESFDSYLYEYMWRRRNKNTPDLMRQFLGAIKIIYPPSVHD